MPLFEMDDAGWIAQNKGRPINELFRELLQNAMDGDGDEITVRVDSRGRQLEVIDNGSGISDLRDAYAVFGGDKGGDPTKRGRFGRGLKEFIASTQYTKVQTTSGTVEFDVENLERTEDPSERRETGTRVLARNDDWRIGDLKELWQYVLKIWPPEGLTITVDVKGGRTEVNTRDESWTPDFTSRTYFTTVQMDEESGQMEQTRRSTDVHIMEAKGQDGRLYEMGIPVDLEAPFPFYVDIQQKIPMAEQRNEPDSWWYNRELKKGLISILWERDRFESLSRSRLREDWFVEALDKSYNDDAKAEWVDRVIRDKRKQGVVVSSDERSDDIAKQNGWQVYDPKKSSSAAGAIVKDVAETSRSVARDIKNREKHRVDPSPAQEDFIKWAEEFAQMCGYPDAEFELWNWEPATQGEHKDASNLDGVIQLNTRRNDWTEPTPSVIGLLIHELAHDEGVGHDRNWSMEMQRIAGNVIYELM